jgi:hypothetical protein
MRLFVKGVLYEQYDKAGGDFSGKINTAACAADHRKTNSTPRRRPNAKLRTLEHLTEQEVGRMGGNVRRYIKRRIASAGAVLWGAHR